MYGEPFYLWKINQLYVDISKNDFENNFESSRISSLINDILKKFTFCLNRDDNELDRIEFLRYLNFNHFIKFKSSKIQIHSKSNPKIQIQP